MKKSCGLCVDNSAAHSLEISTTYGTTCVVPICWPCLQKRMNDAVHDLHPALTSTRLGGVVGFTVTTP
jgi:hypothetical protein